jgi:thiamine-monophosphate kinase
VVDASLLPLSAVGRGIPGAREAALAGGDDYEILFTVPADRRAEVEALRSRLDHELTRVGSVRAAPGLEVVDAGGRELVLDRTGWRHF